MISDRLLIAIKLPRNSIDIVLLLWVIAAIIYLLYQANINFKISNYTNHILSIFIIMLVFFVKYIFQPLITSNKIYLVPYIMELKPVIYIVITLLCAKAFSLPKPAFIVFAGKILSVLTLISVMGESIAARRLVHAHGSGEMNYDALLILIALLISSFRIDQPVKPIDQIWLLCGLALSMSRTAMLALAAVIFVVVNIKLYKKMLIAAFAFGVIIFSFYIRDLPIDQIEKMDRYWMWLSSIEYIFHDVGILINGIPPGAELKIVTPANIEWLWSTQAEGWGLNGVFPFHLHAMWLRLLATWGLPIVIVVLLFLVKTYVSTDNLLVRALIVVIGVESLTMGVFYLSNVSIPLILTILIASSYSHESTLQLESKRVTS